MLGMSLLKKWIELSRKTEIKKGVESRQPNISANFTLFFRLQVAAPMAVAMWVFPGVHKIFMKRKSDA